MMTRSIALLLPVVAAFISAALIVVLQPLLARYAMARPNARSSHAVPTPQGGGIAVVAATISVTIPALAMASLPAADLSQILILCGSAACLAIVGAIDDIRTIDAVPRLVMQFVAVGVVVGLLPSDIHIVPSLPLWLERIMLIVGGVWFVNLTNFMDGIDWMTVTETVAIVIGLLLLAFMGMLPLGPAVVALALLGAILGFAPFNRPVAKLFLGDVGSLPLGLIVFWLLVQLAGNGQLTAAVILPLYYLADATITLLVRIARREPIMQAHRGHFYQQATGLGLSVPQVIARIALLNGVLIIFALLSAAIDGVTVDVAAIGFASLAVALLLRQLAKGRN